MGFSDWVHIDFKVIRRVIGGAGGGAFDVVAEDGKIYQIPKSKVAYARDYKAGDRNGTISVKEDYAKEKGWIED